MMLRRIAVSLNLIFIASSWVCASQVWASATIRDSGEVITMTASDAYPQLVVVFTAGILLVWISRYLEAVFARFLGSAIVLFLFAAVAPVWFDAAAGSLNILSPTITKKTGVSDWLSQAELISNSSYNHLASDVFILMMIGWLFAAMTLLWTRRPGSSAPKFATRIDNLPSW